MRAYLFLACLALAVVSAAASTVDADSQAEVEGGVACNVSGVKGVCTASPCAGTTVVGLCRGAANIKCCLPKVSVPKSAASVTSKVIAKKNVPAPLPKVLPILGGTCKAFGALGVCATESSCTNGRAYYGFCAGTSNIKCCVPAVKKSAIVNTKARKAITKSAAARLTEAEHKIKWAAFKALNRKRYSSPAVEAQRYAQFKVNRESIVHANDRLGRREALYSSESPFADIAPAAFRSKYLNSARSTTTRQVLLEMHAKSGEWHSDNESDHEAESDSDDSTLLESSAESQAEVDAEADAEAEAVAEMEAEAQVEAEVEAFTTSANPKCDAAGGVCKSRASCNGVVQTGKCAGTEYCCVGGGSAPVAPIPSYGGDLDAKCAASKGVCMTWRDCSYSNGKVGDSCNNNDMTCCTPPLVPLAQKDLPPDMRTVQGTLTIDYRAIQSPMKMQADCGSCWAHAAMEAYESAGVRAGKWSASTSYGVQQLLDCITQEQGNMGCTIGGLPESAFTYFSKNKPALEVTYPYTAVQGTCQNAAAGAQADVIASFGNVNDFAPSCRGAACDAARLKDALEKYGPLVVSIDATNWQFYNSGLIFPEKDCTFGTMNHATLLVGYGSEVDAVTGQSQNFWLIRNSWSKNWNEAGYIRVHADGVQTGCNVHLDPLYVTF